MNKANIVKILTLLGKLSAVAGAFTGSLDPKVATIVFVASSIVKDVANSLVSFLSTSDVTTTDTVPPITPSVK